MTDVIVLGFMCALPVGALIFLYVVGVRRDRREAASAVLVAKFNALDADFAIGEAFRRREEDIAMACEDEGERVRMICDITDRSIEAWKAHTEAIDAI